MNLLLLALLVGCRRSSLCSDISVVDGSCRVLARLWYYLVMLLRLSVDASRL
jgi:hypothetical protein